MTPEGNNSLYTLYHKHVEVCNALAAYLDLERIDYRERGRSQEGITARRKAVEILKDDAFGGEIVEKLENVWKSRAAIFSLALPPISEAELRKNCIYRGGLLRNLRMAEDPGNLEEGVIIEDLAFKLNNGVHVVDFTGLNNQNIALNFARTGFSGDHRKREDAVIVEVPFDLLKRLIINIGNGEESRISLSPNLFKGDRLRIFRPVDT